MDRDEFITELKKLLPPYLKLKVRDPMKNYNADILVYLDYAVEPLLIFCGETYDDDTGEYTGYIYKDGAFDWDMIYSNATFEVALNYFKTNILDVAAKLKNILDNYDRGVIDDTLTGLGFTKLDGTCYDYKSDGLLMRIYTLNLKNASISPFTLRIVQNGDEKIWEDFLTLDDLLDFIVKGGK